MDDLGRGGAGRRLLRHGPRARHRLSRYLSGDDRGGDGDGRRAWRADHAGAGPDREVGGAMAPVNGTGKSAELVVLTIVGAALFFGGWQVLAMSGAVSKQVLPSPLAVLDAGWTMMQKPFAGNLLQAHVLASLQRFAMGFGLAALIGVPLGLAMG